MTEVAVGSWVIRYRRLPILGRTSGAKSGMFGSIKSTTAWLERPGLTKEYAVCHRSKGYALPYKGFAQEGRSSVSVLNQTGEPNGILVARTKDNICKAQCMEVSLNLR